MEVSDQHSYVTRRHKTKRKGEVEFSEVHLRTPTFSSFSTAKWAKARVSLQDPPSSYSSTLLMLS